MDSNDRARVIAAVKALFTRLKEGRVKLLEERVPQLVAEVQAVRFDGKGEPIYETIGPLVRVLARTSTVFEIADERAANSPVHQHLGEVVPVDDQVIADHSARGSLSPLAFELYKEAVTVLSVAASAYFSPVEESALPRNQAICAGLLIRITKYMVAVANLISELNCGEVVMSLNRSIAESATNLRYLVLKKEPRFFDQFVEFSLSPERELYDLISRNVAQRGGEVLPIERRMLSSIEKLCAVSGVKITEVPAKCGDWGGGLRNRLAALGDGDRYVGLQRIQSHAVHGTWVDLVMRHLTKMEDGFQPDPTWTRADSRLMLPICILALEAATAYLNAYFSRVPELEPLYERITDLDGRIRKVDHADEQAMSRPGD